MKKEEITKAECMALSLVLMLVLAPLLLMGQMRSQQIPTNQLVSDELIQTEQISSDDLINEGAEIDFNSAEVISSHNAPIMERINLTFEYLNTMLSPMGHSMALCQGSSTLWHDSYGVSHDEVAIDSNSLFFFTPYNFSTLLTLQLYQEGLLKLNDSIYHWIPYFDNVDSTITVYQLLTWQSGLDDFYHNSALRNEMLSDKDKFWTNQEILSRLNKGGNPGENGSMTNHKILAMIVEAITGNSFEAELNKRVLDPCGMTHTFTGKDTTRMSELVHPSHTDSDNHENYNTISYLTFAWPWAASSILDLNRFNSHFYYHKSLLHDSIYTKYIFNKDVNMYGIDKKINRYGNEVTDRFGIGYYDDNIEWDGLHTYIPEDSLAISYLSNKYYTDNELYEILGRLYTAVLNYAPTNIEPEVFGAPLGSVDVKVADLKTVDTNYVASWDMFTYTLVDGDGSNDSDNSCFEIKNDNELFITCPLEDLVYNILLKSEDGYGGEITVALGMEIYNSVNHNSIRQLEIYPNPVNDQLYVNIPQEINHKPGTIEIYTLDGKVVNSIQLQFTDDLTISTEEMQQGIYLIKLSDGNQNWMQPFVKQY